MGTDIKQFFFLLDRLPARLQDQLIFTENSVTTMNNGKRERKRKFVHVRAKFIF